MFGNGGEVTIGWSGQGVRVVFFRLKALGILLQTLVCKTAVFYTTGLSSRIGICFSYIAMYYLIQKVCMNICSVPFAGIGRPWAAHAFRGKYTCYAFHGHQT